MIKPISIFLIGSFVFMGCGENNDTPSSTPTTEETNFNWNPENFANIKVGRYKVPGFNQLTLKQKKLVYYLTQAGLSGRDIIWDMNNKYNLEIRGAIEHIIRNFEGDKNTEDWKNFVVYVKTVWLCNGIYSYASSRIIPTCPKLYLESLLKATDTPLSPEMVEVIYDGKKDTREDVILASSSNYYGVDVTKKEVEDFYGKMVDKNDKHPIAYGLNSQLIHDENGVLVERVWKIGGMYSPAIEEIVKWLEKATTVVENKKQKEALVHLIKYYRTGNLRFWDDYNVSWLSNTECDIDFVNGFVEVYLDPAGIKGAYESIIYITDFIASAQLKIIAKHAQWFEDNAPIMEQHKRKKVKKGKGIFSREVSMVGGYGEVTANFPVGINLPNSEWISVEHGAKVINFKNIKNTSKHLNSHNTLYEFAYSKEEIELSKRSARQQHNIFSNLYNTIGYTTGQINPGVGNSSKTLKNYATIFEESHAALVALYFILDQKIVDLGVMSEMEIGKAFYDDFIRNELLIKLRNMQPGKKMKGVYMVSRNLIATWVLEKGAPDNIIEKIRKNEKTYFVITDYNKLRALFGDLLREVQRIISEGDYEAGKKMVETYGMRVDSEINKEVIERAKNIYAPSFIGFINPEIVPIKNEEGEIINVRIEYPKDFAQQMLGYSEKYSFLTKK